MTEYKTSDLYLAAFLNIKGYEMSAKKVNRERVEFLFKGGGIDAEVTRYFNGKTSVDAQSYASSVKNLKSMCHSFKAAK